jgi:hypothetical protein
MINYAVFNELSATPSAENVGKAKQWLLALCDLMKQAAKLNFRRLRTRDDFKQIPLVLVEDGRMMQIILKLDRDNRNFILKVLDSPYLVEDNHEAAYLSHHVISVGGRREPHAEGVLSAYVADTLAISLESADRWKCDQLELSLRLDPGEELPPINLPHACRGDHLLSYSRVRWALGRTWERNERLPVPNCPLPNTKASDQLVNADWNAFYLTTSRLPQGEKRAKLQGVANDVAFLNGYDLCPRRSSVNSERAGANRQIFVSVFRPEGHEMYLSTDFEKPAGAFEVYDQNGRHLGEWLFAGRKNGEADASGLHNIEI